MPTGVYIRKPNIKYGMAGKKHSIETKKKISNIHKKSGHRPPLTKGQIPWNKGKKNIQVPYWLGKKRPNMTGKNHPMFGKSRSISWRNKLSKSHRGKMLGKNNPMWKGGRMKLNNGYIMTYAPNHPFARHNHILEHRLIMERHLGRYLSKNEVVHHINGIKDDNRLKNLKLVVYNKNWHPKTCPKCGFKFLVK